jgi:hypothetical protein
MRYIFNISAAKSQSQACRLVQRDQGVVLKENRCALVAAG